MRKNSSFICLLQNILINDYYPMVHPGEWTALSSDASKEKTIEIKN